MYRRVAVIFLGPLCSTVCAFSDQWADGNISLTRPDSSRFVESNAAYPAITVHWVSQDETVVLGITETANPQRFQLIQSDLEEGCAAEINGKIIASSAEKHGDRTVYKMTARGNVQGNVVYVTQAVVALGDKVYKVMATGIGKDTRADPDATSFIASLKVLNQGAAPGTKSMNRSANGSFTSRFSRRVGGISLLLLIACVIVIVVSRSTKRRRGR